ncbi:MAG: beta-ketoacyl-[acyl-carrier-protein] synthase family protein [Planctomycetaceae bacterium]|nr:beta-ketoacyl-[acyl-carrier-protein] synthase family protein [Planctomycetaceae bacterium]
MSSGNKRRVVVTGLGAVTPLGRNLETTWESVLAARSGIGRISLFDPTHWPVQIGGEVADFDFAPYGHPVFADLTPVLPRMAQLGIAAAQMAMDDSGLDGAVGALAPHRVGISLGALSNMIDLEERDRWRRLKDDFDPPRYPEFDSELEMRLPQSHVVRTIATRWRCGGPCLIVSTACAAGTQAVGAALRAIQRGDADIMLAGGFDSMVHEVTLICFSLLGALSTRNDAPQEASRPFDKSRDGFVIAEGAAILVLEELEHARQRGAHIYAELAGYGASLTTEHITDTSKDGGHPARAMTLALTDAGMSATDVDYINAHGTSTRANDLSETIAIRRAFGEHANRLAVSSTKSMTGHLVHAAGALEAAFSVLAIRDRVAPPTTNYQQADPACDLDYVPNTARELPIDVVLSNSFAFGGNNASVVFRRF